jgi:hypothetical protein
MKTNILFGFLSHIIDFLLCLLNIVASGSSPIPHDRKKIDVPPNLKKDGCYTNVGGIDRKSST